MFISTPRITLRDFKASDRAGFVAYQMDARYRRLYGLAEDQGHAEDLFDLFLGWQGEEPRRNFQLGLFDTMNGQLCGCAGLRVRPEDHEAAVLGIELAPSEWGRYRIALDATACLVEEGFSSLQLRLIVGNTASGNKRVEKIARWFGASITDRRDGPEWMRARGWQEIDWTLTRAEWHHSQHRGEILKRLRSFGC